LALRLKRGEATAAGVAGVTVEEGVPALVAAATAPPDREEEPEAVEVAEQPRGAGLMAVAVPEATLPAEAEAEAEGAQG
jgi:hypothetical protein